MRIIQYGCLPLLLMAASAMFREGAVTASAQTSKPAKTSTSVEKLLSVQDVEKVGGISGVKLAPVHDQSLKFSTQVQIMGGTGDFLVLQVTVLPAGLDWESWAAGLGPLSRVSDVGDDARQDRKNCMLVLHKGKRTVMMQCAMDPNQKFYLSAEQMHELARLVASRL